MLFSSLAKLLTDKYPVSICEVPLDCEVVDVVLYEETKPLPSVDCLCVFTAKQMSDAESLPLNIVCVGEIDTTTYGRAKNNNSNFILIPDASSADAVCYILSIFGNTLKQQKLYSDLIYMLLSDEDLASIFCTFAKETDCQMLAIDITGKVLAYSKPFRVNHPHWLHSVEVGYLDKYLIEYILSYRVKHNMSISPQPFVLFCDRLQLFIKTIRVIYNGEIIAYAFMGNYTGEFPEFSDRFMSLIAKRMLNTLLGSRSYSTYRFNMHQNILADIIKGASEEEAVQRISVANLSFPSHMLANDWGKYDITVNCIAPGYFPSELTAAYIDSDAFTQLHKDRCPKSRHGLTGEMDGLCVYFASTCCSYTTGQTVAVDGGWTCT